jgi:hypothetical protein
MVWLDRLSWACRIKGNCHRIAVERPKNIHEAKRSKVALV